MRQPRRKVADTKQQRSRFPRGFRVEGLEDRRLLSVAPTGLAITSTTIIENTSGAVGELSATDADAPNDQLSYSINGTGPDDSRFSITQLPRPNGFVAALTFQTTPDFESPLDVDANNIYEVDVRVQDQDGNSQVESFEIEVLDSDSSVPGIEPLGVYHRIFVTSSLTALTTDRSVPPPVPRFGGIEAASWITTNAASNAGLLTNWDGLTPIYRAVLSDSTADAIDHTNIQGPVLNMADELLALDAEDFFDGQLRSPIFYDENGDLVTSPFLDAWSGTAIGGTAIGGTAVSSGTCVNWDSTTASLASIASTRSSQWIDGSSADCSDIRRLIGISPPLIADFDVPSDGAPQFELGEDAQVGPEDQGQFQRDAILIQSFEQRKPLQVEIDYGDGSPPVEVTLSAPGDDETIDLSKVYDATDTYTVSVKVTDNAGAAATDTILVDVDLGNSPPLIDVDGDVVVDEGDTATNSGTVSDPDGDGVTLDASAGNVINNNDGTWSWSWDTSDGPDESQVVTINVDDGKGGTSSIPFDLTVQNVAPTVTLSGVSTANEGDTKSYSFTTSDPGDDTFSLVSYSCGANGNLSGLSFDSTTGAGSFACTFPDGPANSDVSVKVADSDLANSHLDTVTVAITNVVPTIALSGAASVSEGDVYTLILGTVTDPGDDTVTSYVVNWGDGNSDTYGSAGDVTHTYADGDSSPTIRVDLVDEDGTHLGAGTRGIAVANVAPTVTLLGAATANEGETKSYSYSTSDPGDEVFTLLTESCGIGGVISNSNFDSATGSGSFDCSFPDGPASPDVSVSVSDGSDNGSDTVAVAVANVAPTVGAPIIPLVPININEQAGHSVDAIFSDPAGVLDEDYKCTFDMDVDNVANSPDEVLGVAYGSCSNPLEYTEPGVYKVSVTVADDDGATSIAQTAAGYIVIYDPSGGFVTGGGWIESAAGALVADPTAAGKATFGFVSKYKKGASVPTGNTQFQFKTGDLNFQSNSYDFLVVNQGGSNAQYQGTGTINGSGSYKFKIWATEVDGGPDTFRIKIWNEGGGGVIYDNGAGGLEQSLGGGSIKVHKAKKK